MTTRSAPRRLLRASDLWVGEIVSVDAGGCRVLLARLGDRVVAYRDRCPHQGVPLSEGALRETVLTCRAHHYAFDLRTGRCDNPSTLSLEPIAVGVEEDFIVLEPEAADA